MVRLKKVLLVDNDYVTTFLNKLIIKEADLVEEIIAKGNGLEALNYLKIHCTENGEWSAVDCPDLILLDLNMPIMNGISFLKQLLLIGKKPICSTIVILSTEDTMLSVLLEREKEIYGIKGVIKKPLTKDKLLKLLNQGLFK